MPDDGVLSARSATDAPSSGERTAILAFIADAQSESILREAIVEAVPQGMEIRRGNIRTAINVLSRVNTPRTLIVDVSGEEQPLTALGDLSQVVEPDVRVLVIGDLEDVNFYRHITRGLGALEYLYKPLSRDMVARHFRPFIVEEKNPSEAVLGGRIVTITGVRGGVGATTVAANLAWHFGVAARRHTVLFDPDLYCGTAALLLNAKTGSGLRTALESPERIDELFVERAAQPVADRLHVLAGEEKLSDAPSYAPDAAVKLLEALRRRYNFVVADVPFLPLHLNRDLLDLAHQRVLVLDPSLAAARDTLRLLALPPGPSQPRRAVVVLNRLGRPGGLTSREVEEALKMRPDVTIPDLPRLVGTAASMGEPAVAARGGFRTGIVELAREVAFVRLLDSSAGTGSTELLEPRRRRRLFGRRR
ncbi:MAG: pilus assembly protein [Rhodospirillales bacterium]|nr:pilus assembly protein [Rhodospirillales bacterium]